MASGKPQIDIFLRCAKTGEKLVGAHIEVRDAAGRLVAEISRDAFLCEELGEGGVFTVEEDLAPHPSGISTIDPGTGQLKPTHRVAYPTSFEALPGQGRGSITIEHYPIGRAIAIEEEPGEEEPGEDDGSGVGRVSPAVAGWMAGVAGICAACAWLATPLIWVLCFTVVAFASPGFGPLWAMRNLIEYFASGWWWHGWDSVLLLAGAYSPNWFVHLGAVAGTVLIASAAIRRLTQWAEGKTMPSNPMLDAMPPAAGSNEAGSMSVERSIEGIERVFETYDPASASPPERAGVNLGFLPRRVEQEAASALSAGVVRALGAARIPAPEWARRRAAALGQRRFVYSPHDENTMILGDTRSGKTRRVLLATIDLLSRCEKESMLIIDPKGELYAYTSETLRERGVSVHRVDFRFPHLSEMYNPMYLVCLAAKMGGDVNGHKVGDWNLMEKAARGLVEMLLPTENDTGQNKFFNEGARSYIRSAILFVASEYNRCPDDQRSLATVSRVIERYGSSQPENPNDPKSKTFTPYLWMLDYLPRDHPAVQSWSMARGAQDKERSQFVTTAQSALQDYRDANIAAMSSDTVTPMTRLGEERTATYVIIPHEEETYGAFATLYIQQAFTELVKLASRRGGRLDYRVNIIGEEFDQIPPVPRLKQKMNVSLGYGIRWLLVLQSIAQLSSTYGRDEAETLKGACENKCLLKTTDIEATGKWFESLLGEYTIAVEGQSLSGKRIAPFKENESASTSLRSRKVLMASEIGKWRADYGNLMHRGASNGGYVVPLPDVSQTPTQQAFGLGSPAHNTAKAERVLFHGDPPKRVEAQDWSPELDELKAGKVYSESDKRTAEAVYLARLVSRKERAASRQAHVSKEPRWAVLYNPLSPDECLKPLVQGTKEYNEARAAHPGWEEVTGKDRKNAQATHKRKLKEAGYERRTPPPQQQGRAGTW